MTTAATKEKTVAARVPSPPLNYDYSVITSDTDPAATLLLEAKNEYNKQLVSHLRQPVFNLMKGIYNASEDICHQENTPENILMVFQDNLAQVPKWSKTRRTKEYDEFLKISKCDWFNELIKFCYITHVKILTIVNKPRLDVKLSISIPSGGAFFHSVCVSVARELWRSPFLFNKNVGGKYEYQKNMRQIEQIIDNSVDTCIRAHIPMKAILHEYLADDVGIVAAAPSDSNLAVSSATIPPIISPAPKTSSRTTNPRKLEISNELDEFLDTTSAVETHSPTTSSVKAAVPEIDEALEAVQFSKPDEALEAVQFSKPDEALEAVQFSKPDEALEAVQFSKPDEALEAVQFSKPDEALEAVQFSKPDEALEAVQFSKPDEIVDELEIIEPALDDDPTTNPATPLSMISEDADLSEMPEVILEPKQLAQTTESLAVDNITKSVLRLDTTTEQEMPIKVNEPNNTKPSNIEQNPTTTEEFDIDSLPEISLSEITQIADPAKPTTPEPPITDTANPPEIKHIPLSEMNEPGQSLVQSELKQPVPKKKIIVEDLGIDDLDEIPLAAKVEEMRTFKNQSATAPTKPVGTQNIKDFAFF
jgi:hypothetical protein